MLAYSFVLFATLLFLNPVEAKTIIDLSKDFEAGNLDSSGAKMVVDTMVIQHDFVRRLLVLEKGKIVVDYTREGCNKVTSDLFLCDTQPEIQWCKKDDNGAIEICDVKPDDTFISFSTAKSFDSLALGLLVDAGLLTLNDTLGEIFIDDSTWENATHAEYVQGVSIEKLLTMTSGLTFDIDWNNPNSCPYEGLPG